MMLGLYKKAGLTFVFKIIGLGIGFLLQILFGRLLNPEIYGEYTLFLTYSTIFSMFTILGMDRNLIKEGAKYQPDDEYPTSLLRFSLGTSFVIFVLISGILLILKDILNISTFSVFLIILIVFEKTLVALLDGYLQGKGYIAQVTAINTIVANLFKALSFIFLIYINTNKLFAAISSYVLSELVLILYRVLRIQKKYKLVTVKKKSRIIRKEKKDFIKYSFTVALLSGIGILLQSIDKIIIAKYLNTYYVGIYKVAQNYIGLLGIFITPFIAFWPLISQLFHEKRISELESEMRNIISIITHLTIPMFFIFMYFSEDLLQIFGDSYLTRESVLVLQILSVSFLIDAISGPIGAVLTMTKYAKVSLYNSVICLCINVFLSLLLVRSYGIIGVAFATGISIIINNLISIIEVRRLVKIFPYSYKNFIRIIVIVSINFVFIRIFKEKIMIARSVINLMVNTLVLYMLNALFYVIINYHVVHRYIGKARD